MCREDSFGLPRLGEIEDVKAITPQSLYDHYQRILKESRLEIFYVGSAEAAQVKDLWEKLLSGLDRSYIPLGEQTAFTGKTGGAWEEAMDIAQGKLAMGFVTPANIRQGKPFVATQMMNLILGGGMTSKLFTQVREKMSLCYAISSGYHGSKGILTVNAGMDWEKKDTFLCIRLRSQRPVDGIPAGGALGSHLASSLNSYYSFYRDRGLYIVVNLSRGGQSASSIRQVLAPYVRDSFLYGGISNPVTGLHQLRYGFMQTEFILEYLDEKRSGIWLLPYQDCALEYLRSTVAERMPAEVLAAPALLRLRQLDGENDTEYYKTLKVYLTMERDIPRAAQELIIHRTTLLYRLKKIQALVHLNLDDPWVRLHLLLSLWILDSEKSTGQ
jgi:hypothetical protein